MEKRITENKDIHFIIEQIKLYDKFRDELQDKMDDISKSVLKFEDKVQKLFNLQVKKEFDEMVNVFLEYVNNGRWPKIYANQIEYDDNDPMILFDDSECPYIQIVFYLDDKIVHAHLSLERFYSLLCDVTDRYRPDDEISVYISEKDGTWNGNYEEMKKRFADATGCVPEEEDLCKDGLYSKHFSPETSFNAFLDLLDVIENKIMC